MKKNEEHTKAKLVRWNAINQSFERKADGNLIQGTAGELFLAVCALLWRKHFFLRHWSF
jgi:hypothetical protein